MAIWQDLVSEHGFRNSYQSVKRYIHKRRGSELPQATAVILTAPGEEAQVDYGTGPMVRDPAPRVIAISDLACILAGLGGLVSPSLRQLQGGSS